MKNDLTCDVVRDLLPSYAEDLLSEASREAVERHLEGCAECVAQKEAMAALACAEAEETEKKVDYFKRVKKGTAKKIVLAMVCTVLAVALGLLAREFVIGRTPDPEMIDIESAQVDGENNLTLLLDTYWGAYELRGLKPDTKDGVLSYTAREVRTNLFQLLSQQEKTDGNVEGYSKQTFLSIPLDGLSEVWICGRLVWQEGLIIHRDTLRLLDAKTASCQDTPAVERITGILQLQEFTGGHTMSLQANERPYVLTLTFEKRISPFIIWDWTECYFLQILALVDNLDEVAYAFEPEKGCGWTVTGGRVTVEYATEKMAKLTEAHNRRCGTDWPIHENFKEYTESPLEYQRMITLLEENGSYRQGVELIWSDAADKY